MERRVLGVIVAGSLGSPLGRLGAPNDRALLPFAGRYRMVDFALATLLNSGVRDIHWCVPRWATELTAYIHRSINAAERPGRSVLPLAASAEGAGRVYRLLAALQTTRPLVQALQVETIVVLAADHVLRLDLRHLLDVHEARGADVTLPAVSLAAADSGGRPVLQMDAHHRVTEVRRSTRSDPLSADGDGVVLAWSGDLVVRAAALPALLGPIVPPAVRDDTLSLGVLATTLHLSAHDVFDVGARAASAMRTYWHEPDTVDAYYIAQMQLCVARSPLDLYDPTWPLPTAATGFAPAKVVTCNAGRAGQAIDSLVSDGSLIRGGAVIKSVVGPGVLVDSGAEVEDCVLLDGCRIGRGARVRRAVVGAGVTIGEAEEIGYAARPPAPAEVLRSGLTLVPPTSGGAAAAVGAR